MSVFLTDATDFGAEAINEYHANGLVLVRVPAEIMALQTDLLVACCVWLNRFAGECVDIGAVSAAIPAIASRDRQVIARLYKISRRFQAAKQLSSHPWFVGIAKTLMDTKLVSCCHFINVRIDLPGEHKYLLPIHQDFPYIQGSLNGITVWLPLHDTSLTMGPPSWIPGSHLRGVQRIRERKRTDGRSIGGGDSFELVDETQFERKDFTSVPVQFGQALIFSTQLLHCSASNQSSAARMNVQLRFDDALSETSYERNYPDGTYLHEPLASAYPEYVVSDVD